MTPTLEAIWHEFAGKQGQFIRARVPDPATVEEILQDGFVKIQAELDTLEDPARLQGCHTPEASSCASGLCLQPVTPASPCQRFANRVEARIVMFPCSRKRNLLPAAVAFVTES